MLAGKGQRTKNGTVPTNSDSENMEAYLNPRLGEIDFHGDLLAGVNVRIVCLLEGTL